MIENLHAHSRSKEIPAPIWRRIGIILGGINIFTILVIGLYFYFIQQIELLPLCNNKSGNVEHAAEKLPRDFREFIVNHSHFPVIVRSGRLYVTRWIYLDAEEDMINWTNQHVSENYKNSNSNEIDEVECDIARKYM